MRSRLLLNMVRDLLTALRNQADGRSINAVLELATLTFLADITDRQRRSPALQERPVFLPEADVRATFAKCDWETFGFRC
jgi:hypothetical protein